MEEILMKLVEFKRITKQQGSQTKRPVIRDNAGFKRITKQQGSQTFALFICVSE